METFKLYHNNPNIKTLSEFCEKQRIFFDDENSQVADKYTLQNFFDDNKQRIFEQMGMVERINYIKDNNLNKKVVDLEPDDLNIDMTIPCPMTLVIPKRLVTYTLSVKHSTFQEQVSDIAAFEDAHIKSVFNEDDLKFLFDYRKEKAECSVIGFFKTIYYNKVETSYRNGLYDSTPKFKSNFIDISKFVYSLTTSVSAQGGSFSFSLPHIPMYHNKWEYDKDINSDILLDNSDFNVFSASDEQYPVVKSSLKTMDYFNWLISPNDLILLSFDKISEESVTDDMIGRNSFDMIGLVESVNVTRDSQGNVTVQVTGKDLMKLLTDDCSIFFPNATAVNQGNFFDNTEGALNNGDIGGVIYVNGEIVNDDDMLRMPCTHSIRLFMEECNGFTIDYILKVVISELANIQICPSEIFSSWFDRTTFNYLKPKQENS